MAFSDTLSRQCESSSIKIEFLCLYLQGEEANAKVIVLGCLDGTKVHWFGAQNVLPTVTQIYFYSDFTVNFIPSNCAVNLPMGSNVNCSVKFKCKVKSNTSSSCPLPD